MVIDDTQMHTQNRCTGYLFREGRDTLVDRDNGFFELLALSLPSNSSYIFLWDLCGTCSPDWEGVSNTLKIGQCYKQLADWIRRMLVEESEGRRTRFGIQDCPTGRYIYRRQWCMFGRLTQLGCVSLCSLITLSITMHTIYRASFRIPQNWFNKEVLFKVYGKLKSKLNSKLTVKLWAYG